MVLIDPLEFARRWEAAWNAHDLDAVLAHFHDDVVFTSPVAAQIIEGSEGTIRGKESLRAYWEQGLKRIPDLRFEVQRIFVGIDTIVIQYRNQKGVDVSEVLIFSGEHIREGHGAYQFDTYNPTDAR